MVRDMGDLLVYDNEDIWVLFSREEWVNAFLNDDLFKMKPAYLLSKKFDTVDLNRFLYIPKEYAHKIRKLGEDEKDGPYLRDALVRLWKEGGFLWI